MSGIVGSSHNIRGSGLVAKLGTDGQVFTSSGAGVKQTFEDAAGGGAWTYLDTQTGTSVSALSFDGDFTSDYDVYKFFFNGTGVTANTDTAFRFRSGDADVTGDHYRSIGHRGINTGGTVSTGFLGESLWDTSYALISSDDNNANIAYPVNIELTLYNPLATDRYKLFLFQSSGWNSNTDPALIRSHYGAGFYHDATGTALTGVTFFYDGGNITGTVQEYGIKNS